MPKQLNAQTIQELARLIKLHAAKLGFQHTGISNIELAEAESHLLRWLKNQYHGQMHYMEKHGSKRSRPAELEPGTVSIISVRLNYFPERSFNMQQLLTEQNKAYISRYALGRDYHKIMRKQLQKLANYIETRIGPFNYRVFSDSAPVLEKALAEKAGLGWIGKHTNLIHEKTGSWFFLGEIYTDLPLPVDTASVNHCGTCDACMKACPTAAIVAPYQLDARLCISYLTIEYAGSIPVALRPLMGNRIYGCDDCQIVCPWNRFTAGTEQEGFFPRHDLDRATLLDLFQWSEQVFLQRFEGSPIRRIGYQQWLRNIAVALGNAPYQEEIVTALKSRLKEASPLLSEHIIWALTQLNSRNPYNNN